MKYFIGFLIEGKAAEWHAGVAKDISDKFGTWKIYEKLPPHVTIFDPFEAGDIGQVKKFFKNWVDNRKVPGSFILSGFEHFDDRVVFAKLDTNQSIDSAVQELRESLREIISVMPKKDLLEWHPHATLAYKLSSQEISRIYDYVLTLEKPDFVLPFNNVTIFRKEGEQKWVVEESYKFSK